MYVCSSIDEALILTQKEELKEKVESVFVIGGGQIYKEAIGLPECTKLYLTEVDNDVVCDTFFPSIPSVFTLTVLPFVSHSPVEEGRGQIEKGTVYRFLEYTRGFESFLPPYRTDRNVPPNQGHQH